MLAEGRPHYILNAVDASSFLPAALACVSGESLQGLYLIGSSLGSNSQDWFFPAKWGGTVPRVSLYPEMSSLQVFKKALTSPPLPPLS